MADDITAVPAGHKWTSDEVAARLRVKPGTMRTWRHKGKGPAWVKFEGSIRYLEADVAEYEQKARAAGLAAMAGARSYQVPASITAREHRVRTGRAA